LALSRSIGLHLRLLNSFSALAEQAIQFQLPIFQFFLMPQGKNKYLRITKKDLAQFLELQKNFNAIYVHSSYWINLASGKKQSADAAKRLLIQELELLSQLSIKFLVLHSGSAKGHQKTELDPQGKEAGIEQLASVLNEVSKKFNTITILLENTAHAGDCIGSDFDDFVLLKNKLDRPEQLALCVDLAHAYAYGYSFDNASNFIALLRDKQLLEHIKLIHLNDSFEPCASYKDQHEVPGKGLIGKEKLRNLITIPELSSIPAILELPLVSEEEMKQIIQEISTW